MAAHQCCDPRPGRTAREARACLSRRGPGGEYERERESFHAASAKKFANMLLPPVVKMDSG